MNDLKRNDPYLSDEALERLIAQVEAEPVLLRTPGEFKNDIMRQISLKKKRKKNVELFSYSLKVFAAVAAALTIVFIVPESFRQENGTRPGGIRGGQAQQGQMMPEEEAVYRESFGFALNRRMDGYCSRLNSRLNELVGMEVSDNEKEEK